MTDQLWIDHVGGIVIFLAILLCISFFNLLTLKRLGTFPTLAVWPRVSLLVPARNEARNIEACAHGLLNQDYPDFEVIILDDESSDGTGEILERLAAQHSRLRVIKGQALPAGWLGKNWACQQTLTSSHRRLSAVHRRGHAPRSSHVARRHRRRGRHSSRSAQRHAAPGSQDLG